MNSNAEAALSVNTEKIIFGNDLKIFGESESQFMLPLRSVTANNIRNIWNQSLCIHSPGYSGEQERLFRKLPFSWFDIHIAPAGNIHSESLERAILPI